MVAPHLQEKYDKQTGELYRSLGEFIVEYEHLVFAAKHKITMLCLGQNVRASLEKMKARQTVKMLGKLIELRVAIRPVSKQDQDLFRWLIADMYSVIDGRNQIAHTPWIIGCGDTDFSKAPGFNFFSQTNFRVREIDRLKLTTLSVKCKSLYRVCFTVWPIDPVIQNIPNYPGLAAIWERDGKGVWSDLRGSWPEAKPASAGG